MTKPEFIEKLQATNSRGIPHISGGDRNAVFLVLACGCAEGIGTTSRNFRFVIKAIRSGGHYRMMPDKDILLPDDCGIKMDT